MINVKASRLRFPAGIWDIIGSNLCPDSDSTDWGFSWLSSVVIVSHWTTSAFLYTVWVLLFRYHYYYYLNLYYSLIKENQSLYRHVQAVRVPVGWGSQISTQSAQEGGKVVRPTWYSFLLETESTPAPQCGQKDYVNEKFQWHHRESNPRPFDHRMSLVHYDSVVKLTINKLVQ